MSQKHFLIGFIFIVAILSFGIFQKNHEVQQTGPAKSSYQGQAMGTTYSVVYVTDGQVEEGVIHARIDQAINLVNDQMSTYKTDSNLSIFNQKPAGACYKFPPDTYKVLEMAMEISETTNGAFDVTIGPLVNLWGFGPDYSDHTKPSDESIQELKSTKVGFHNVILKGDNLACKEKDVYVDLSAIAKGYAVDLVAENLDKLGITSYLVEIGGELKAKGIKPNKELWHIAIENPQAEMGRSVHKVLELKDSGIATSGDYRNYYEVDGKRFSHTIDPKSGYPIEHNLASISVLHDSVAYADAMATAMNVMGPDKAMALAEKLQLPVYLLVKEPHGFEVKATDSFIQYIIE
ncbi:FAD:protein FMN transferase [Litoribrevibacter albus]|uniref:FAD:protein FMN transferase n=1 Tax=Litoribrevibacter albus TaxID=1473156 RepID=A0AA37S729_9GAMM|nr:FAD:protein FMN transferase [Litoribrevibacter albus]GLQ30307.1 FAD:protein FMN transferase [Litoribrevibacter albus]